jgi:Na+/H+ antiporter NhaD/arsenite permease-like protein
MKKLSLLTLGAGLLISVSGFAQKDVAQIIGKVVQTSQSNNKCSFMVGSFSYFKSHVTNGIDNVEAAKIVLKDDLCQYSIGKKVSGVLIINADGSAVLDGSINE